MAFAAIAMIDRPRAIRGIEYVSASRLLSTEANSVHVAQMCDAFAALGLAVTLYAKPGKGGSIASEYGLRHHFDVRLQRRLAHRSWLFWKRLRCTNRADSGTVWFGRRPLSLARLASAGYPVALELHHPPRTIKQATAIQSLVRAPRFLGLVAISQRLRAELLNQLPMLDPDRVLVAHDGVSAKYIREPAVRTNVGVRAVYCGTFHAGKGADVIVAAAALVPNVTFDMMGGTPEQIESLRASAPCNVRFLGHVTHDEAQGRLPEYDLALAPYGTVVRGAKTPEHESLASWMSPLKIFEYMAAGLPIVTSDLPVLREILGPERDALMTIPDDPIALAAAIRTLASDPARRLEMAQAAQARLRMHTWEQRARAIIAFLQTPLGAHAAPAARKPHTE
ncbi:MAG TPA: glycosyltransferase family 4 protein [Paraburkholderia sp.]|uniref:glycosyltransferase family 4 protein n=1 Tax=Paraburkholderia sp. TaxID=1926495 RepID=UPI002B46CAEF|nr:glycosyltransferase family 4 protein [Paraburkholderia sp.]HKR46508.1 glycosyltransferase family 4 protein [Paraburkholderia sp.]